MTALEQYQTALESLYLEFAKYPFRPDMPACIPHCFKQSEIDILGSKPLRELGSSELERIAASMITTCGDVEDFKFFLPRIFELSSRGKFIWPDPTTVLMRLNYGCWFQWPEREQIVVKNFLNSWWKCELDNNLGGELYKIEECLIGLCCTGINPRNWLVTWSIQNTISFAKFINENITQIWLDQGFNTWIKDEGVQCIIIIQNFLREPETRLALERAFLASDNPEEQEILSSAEQLLRP